MSKILISHKKFSLAQSNSDLDAKICCDEVHCHVLIENIYIY